MKPSDFLKWAESAGVDSSTARSWLSGIGFQTYSGLLKEKDLLEEGENRLENILGALANTPGTLENMKGLISSEQYFRELL